MKYIVVILLFVFICPRVSHAQVKLRYPLNGWYTALLAELAIAPTLPINGIDWINPAGTGIRSYFDHDGRSNNTTKNYNCLNMFPYDGHTGIDFCLGTLTTFDPSIFERPVFASAPGRVVVTESSCDPDGGYLGNGCGGGYGNQVVLEHDANTRTEYGHLYSLSGSPAVGQQSACGQQLGIAGNSGNSSGPHLHFGLKVKNTSGVWEDRDPYGSPKNADGTSCSGYTGPVYGSYWNGMVPGSTEQPVTECAPVALPEPIILASSYGNNNQSSTPFRVQLTYMVSNPIADSSQFRFLAERKMGNGSWVVTSHIPDLAPNNNYLHAIETQGIHNSLDTLITQVGTYCYRMRMQNVSTMVYSNYSPESCINISNLTQATGGTSQKEGAVRLHARYSNYGGTGIELRPWLETNAISSTEGVQEFQRVTTTNGYQEAGWSTFTMYTSAYSSWIYDHTVVPGNRYCYRVRVKLFTDSFSDWSLPECEYIGELGKEKVYPPTNLRITPSGTITSPEIKLTFDDNANGETGFQIMRSESGKSPLGYSTGGFAGDMSDIILNERNGVSATWNANDQIVYERTVPLDAAKSLVPNTKYCYRLRSFYQISASATPEVSTWSNESCTTTLGTTLTPPSNLTVLSLGSNILALGWTDTTSTETGFEVQRKTGTTGTYTSIGIAPSRSGTGTQATYLSGSLTPSTQYCYRVRAIQGTTYSAYTPDFCVTTKPPVTTTLTPPSNLTVVLPTTNPSTTLTLSFKDNATNETGYQIERKTGAGGAYTLLTTLPSSAGSGTTLSYTNTSLTPSTQYCYRVRTAQNTTYSTYTTPDVCATTASTTSSSTVPTPPSNLTVVNPATNPTTTLQISWKDNSTNETGFDLRRKIGPATSSNSISGLNQVSVSGSGTTKTITQAGLTSLTNYCYQIAAKPTTSTSVYTPWVCGVTK